MIRYVVSGAVPVCLGDLLLLESLLLARNQLVGPVPGSLGRLAYLQNLHLSHNKLDGDS
jgi:hypothetical protein